MWWWIKPLFNTGLVTMLFGSFAMWASTKADDNGYEKFGNALTIVAIILYIPCIVAILAFAANLVSSIFIAIWKPYI